MKSPRSRLSRFVPAVVCCVTAPSASATAQEHLAAPDPGVAALSTRVPTRTEDVRELGLESLWLPIDSRTNVVDFAGRNLPGATVDPDGRLRLRGGRPSDTAVELDGFRVRGSLVPRDLVRRLELSTAGYGAGWADVAGGVVSLDTGVPDNRLRTSEEFFGESRRRDRIGLAAGASGPILRDRLWVAIALQGSQAGDRDLSDAEGIFPSQTGWREQGFQGGTKVVWAVAPNHRLESTTLLELGGSQNGEPVGTANEAQPVRDQHQVFSGVRWLGRLGEAVSARSQVGFHAGRRREMPRLCREDPRACDDVRAILGLRESIFDNGKRHDTEWEAGWQALNAVEARLLSGDGLGLRLRVTSRLAMDRSRWAFRVPGGGYLEIPQGTPVAQVEAPDETRSAANAFRGVQSLEAEARLFNRLWIVPGVALTSAAVDAGWVSVTAHALTPHLGLAWDVTGEGRTWLRAGVHRRVAADLDGLVRFARPTPASTRCQWNPDSQRFDRSCRSTRSDANTLGLPCAPDGLAPDGSACHEGYRLPRAWETSLGAATTLPFGPRLAADLVYRRAEGLEGIRETNRIWNASGRATTGFMDGRARTILDYSSRPAAYRRYLGVIGSAQGHAGPVFLAVSYAYSVHRENGSDWVSPADPLARLEIPTVEERPHSLRALASIDLLGHTAIGLRFMADSGRARSRLYRNDVTRAFEDYRARVGANPGTNLNDPGDDVALVTRDPASKRFDLQFRMRTMGWSGVDLDVFLDVMNLFGWRTVETDASGLTPLPRVSEGTWWRFGLQHRY